MLRLWRFCDHRVFMMSRVVGVAAVGEVVLFGLGGVLAGVEWWAMRGVALVGLTREQGGAGVGVLPLRARGCLRFGGMGFGRFGWGVRRGGAAVRSGGGYRRARGSHLTCWSHTSPRTGLSPPSRGPRDALQDGLGHGRNTPALAGTTVQKSSPRNVLQEHPRPRGDHPSRPAPSGSLCHPFAHHRSPPLKPPTYAPPSRHARQRANPAPRRPSPHPNNRRSFPTATAPARVSTPNFW